MWRENNLKVSLCDWVIIVDPAINVSMDEDGDWREVEPNRHPLHFENDA